MTNTERAFAWLMVLLAGVVLAGIVGAAEVVNIRAVNQFGVVPMENDTSVIVWPETTVPQIVSIVATNPTYSYDTDFSAPDFTGFITDTADSYLFTARSVKIYDDGVTVLWCQTDTYYWRSKGMAVVRDGSVYRDVHFIQFYRKISGVGSWPQVYVQYSDGYARLKAHPKPGKVDNLFGASVVIGPARATDYRPFASIDTLTFLADSSFQVQYSNGETSLITLASVNRDSALLKVVVGYSTTDTPLVIYRSMFNSETNCDVAKVAITSAAGRTDTHSILTYFDSTAVSLFFFRDTPGVHNTSAPDVRIEVERATAASLADGVTTTTSMAPPVVPPDNGGCVVIQMRAPSFIVTRLRSIRDAACEFNFGRMVTAIYYSFSEQLTGRFTP